MKPWQTLVTASFAVTTAAFALARGPDGPDPDTRPDLFRLAVDGLPGGALLSVYGDATAGRAYLAGGYVGVDPARLDGRPPGRLLVYRAPGTFRTLCTADAVLWWTAAVDGAPWAAGERGRVVRYREGPGRELDTADVTQRAVILVRGDDSAGFAVDDAPFVPTGELRRSLGGAGW